MDPDYEEEIDLDEAQFAHFSVEDDEESNHASFLDGMANADIEVDEDEEDGDQFNEADFRRF